MKEMVLLKFGNHFFREKGGNKMRKVKKVLVGCSFLVGFLLITGICFNLAGAEDVEESLIAFWRFDEGEGTIAKDVSGNSHDGKVRGNVKWVEGKFGKALYFSGKNSAVVIPNAGELNPTQAITIEMWMKPDKYDHRERAKMHDLFNKSSDRGPGYRFCYTYGVIVFRSGDGRNYWQAQSAVPEPLTADVWHHIAATYDGINYKVYINGIDATSSKYYWDDKEKKKKPLDAQNYPITRNNLQVTIGSFYGGSAHHFIGAIDEVKIYSKAKTAAQIFSDAQGIPSDVF